MARYASTLIVVALLVATAAAFALTEGLKLEPSPILGTNVTKVFSPALGTAEISFRLRKADTVRVSIVAAGGDVVRTVADSPYGKGRVTVTWDGRDDAGNVVPEGSFKPRVHLSAGRRTIELPNPIAVDVTGPTVESWSVGPLVFSPDGDGRGDRIVVAYVLSEPGRAVLLVNGKRRVATRFARAEDKLDWYGKLEGKALRPGEYALQLRAEDQAGNLGSPTAAQPVTLRYVRLPDDPVHTVTAARFRVRVDTDARAIRWRFAGGSGTSEPGLLALRAPAAPGEYTLYVSVGTHAAKATVVVEPRG